MPSAKFVQQAKQLLAAEKSLPQADAAARATWNHQANQLAKTIAVFSAERDRLYPEFTRGEVSGGDDPFGGGGESGGITMYSPLRSGNTSDTPEAAPPPVPASDSPAFDVPNREAGGADPFADLETPAKPAVDAQEGRVAGITLKKWDPKTPYLKKLKRAKPEALYPEYLKLRRAYSDSSAFFLDVADHFIERGQKDLALRVLSNIAEMDLENAPLLRILGHRLLQLGQTELAVAVFEEVLEVRAEEPQSYRDLAIACEALGDTRRAAELLWDVVKRPWDRRFEGVGLIALGELNALIVRGGKELIPKGMDSRLLMPMPVDLRVVLTWDADNTDLDLWVVDPSGETCKYSHPRTLTGGRMSNDFTGGYGPEEFLIKHALPGKYVVKAHYYGNHQQTLAASTTVQAKITTGFGRKDEKTESVTLRLQGEDEIIEIGGVEIGK